MSQAVFRVTDAPFSARGDGRTDDTAAVQRAVDAAKRVGGTVLFPRGTYLLTTVHLAAGMTLQGQPGAVLRRPGRPPAASSPAAEARIVEGRKWMRMLSTERDAWDGPADSPPLVIRGLALDGNRRQQGPHTAYQLQQAHLIFLTAATRRPGRLRAIVENCHFADSPGDGVSVYTNCSVRVADCTAADCFRGAVVITGGHTVVQILRVRTTGAGLGTGIDLEVDGPGYGRSLRAEVTAEDLDLEGGFDVNAGEGSVFRGTRITSRRPPFFVAAKRGTVQVTDSSFAVGVLSDDVNRVVWPSRVTFTRCAFHVTERDAPREGNHTIAALHVFWNVAGTREGNQQLRLVDCSFAVDADVEASDTVYAILSRADPPALGNALYVQGGNLARGFDQGYRLNPGARVIVDGVERRAQAEGSDRASGWRGTARLVDSASDAAVQVDEERLADALASPALRAVPEWMIVGDRSPAGRAVPGRRGDRFRLRGDPSREWECTHGDALAATWRPLIPAHPSA